jgi:hypothetical protein
MLFGREVGDSCVFVEFGESSLWKIGDSLGVGDASFGDSLGVGDAQNFNQLVETFSFDLFGMHG